MGNFLRVLLRGGQPIKAEKSQKHINFLTEPMGEKRVTELPGVGDFLGRKLKRHGYHKASQVYDSFIVEKQDKEEFCSWLQGFGANNLQSETCFKCLHEYSEQQL